MGYIKWIIISGVWLAVLVQSTGCAQLLGIKRFKSGDTTIDFTTSFGVSADVSQADTLENKRSIKPADNSQ